MKGSPQEISRLLIAWSDGDHAALDELTPLVYAEFAAYRETLQA